MLTALTVPETLIEQYYAVIDSYRILQIIDFFGNKFYCFFLN